MVDPVLQLMLSIVKNTTTQPAPLPVSLDVLFLIHSADPQLRHGLLVRTSVLTFQSLAEQSQTMFAIGETVGPTKWIIEVLFCKLF